MLGLSLSLKAQIFFVGLEVQGLGLGLELKD